MPEVSAAGFGALVGLMRMGDVVATAEPGGIEPGPLFDAIDRKNLVQMTGAAGRFVALDAAAVAQMTALAQSTAPVEWFERTPELGRFIGFEVDGRLVAMAGERLRVPGHTEISAVCCYPDVRGGGLAA
jgi:hypothetical protein